MNDPLVTIVVAPRERFSAVERCLATIVANTPIPHHLVFVVGGAPRYVEELLEQECARHGYELISQPEPLSPNAARNLGLGRATTRYVAFLDNDVVVAPGWLDALVNCAEVTGADIVGPLCLIGEPSDGLVHSAGGTVELVEREGGCELVERHLVDNLCLNTHTEPLERAPCDFAEFHGMLVRRDVFARLGALDESVLSAAEHLDLALQVKAIGGTAWFEPTSLISYLSFAEYTVGDLEYFALRWSEDWHELSVQRLSEKWGLAPASQYLHELALFSRAQRARGRLPAAPESLLTLPDPISHPFAQTNLQLFNQMRSVGASSHELEEIRAGYDTAVALFAASFRPSGKPFLSHLVGTASVLAAYGACPPLLTAALLHAAYDAGTFPDDVKDDYAAQRRWLRRRVGRLPEAIVHEYAHLDLEHVRRYLDDDLDRLPLNIAHAIVIRIANAIEEHLDEGTSYWGSGDIDELRMANHAAWDPVYAAVAPRVGVSAMLELALELDARVDRVQVSEELRSPHAGNYRVTGPETTEPLVPRIRTLGPSVPDPGRGQFVLPAGVPTLRDRVAKVPGRAFGALEGGRVRSRGRSRFVTCDPRQWAYSALAPLDVREIRGPGALRMKIAVKSGELGIGVLLKGSATEFVTPEWSHGPTPSAIEVVLQLPAIEEAGAIVLRSWAPTGVMTRARVEAVEIFRIGTDAL